jgi:thymidylate kinase
MSQSSPIPDATLQAVVYAAELAEPVKNRSEDSRSARRFLDSFFQLLDKSDVRYCVLHSWKELPEHLHTDLDMAVHPQDSSRLSEVFSNLRSQGYSAIQCFNYYANAYYFVFGWFEELNFKTAAVDLIFDHRRSGLIFSDGAEMVAGRRPFKEFWVPSAESEFCYLLAKKVWKGSASAVQSDRMRALVAEVGPAKATEIASKVVGSRWKVRAIKACTTGSIENQLGRSRAKFWWAAISSRPLQLLGFLATEALRSIRRVFQPTGLLIATLGPDGAGKSTVITGLMKCFDRSFRLQRLFHWRPQVFVSRKNSAPVTDPHGKKPRGTLLSAVVLLACFLDYWIGYLFVIRPLLSKSCLVVFDRYFHDVLVDPKRYRYGGPLWFPQFLARLVPEPDMVILLDSDPESVAMRKAELPVAEIQRQTREYRNLRFHGAKVAVVRNDDQIKSTLRASASALAEFMEQRLARRMQQWTRFVA